MIYAAVDSETTGLDTNVDEIIEIAVVLFEASGKTLEQYHSYCSPHSPIPAEATAVNGITMDMVMGYDTYNDQRSKVFDIIKKSQTIVGHNIKDFDLPIMKFNADSTRVYDTLQECRKRYPGRMHNLANMCRAHKLGWDKAKAHGALYDAKMAMELFIALEFDTKQQVSFIDDKPAVPTKLRSIEEMMGEGFASSKSIRPVIITQHTNETVIFNASKPAKESRFISDDVNMPRVKNGALIIPFTSPNKYHWWKRGGQTAIETLVELGASHDLLKKYGLTDASKN